MKAFKHKLRKIHALQEEIMKDLTFQSLSVENKRDFYKSVDHTKTFAHNLPPKFNK